MRYRLKEKHAAHQALEKLSAYAETLGLDIQFYGPRTVLTFNDKAYDLNYNVSCDIVQSLPIKIDFKLTYDE